MMLKLQSAPRLAERPERMDVSVSRPIPVAELDPEFERGACGAHELGLIQVQEIVEDLDMRQRRLADADNADLVRLDEGDAIVGSGQPPRHHGGGHPAGRPAPDDDDTDWAV